MSSSNKMQHCRNSTSILDTVKNRTSLHMNNIGIIKLLFYLHQCYHIGTSLLMILELPLMVARGPIQTCV